MSILRDDAFNPNDVLELQDEQIDDIDGLIDSETEEKERWREKLEFSFSLPIEQALMRFCALHKCSRATGIRWALMMIGRESRMFYAETPDGYMEKLVTRALFDNGYLDDQVIELEKIMDQYTTIEPQPVGFFEGIRMGWIRVRAICGL